MRASIREDDRRTRKTNQQQRIQFAPIKSVGYLFGEEIYPKDDQRTGELKQQQEQQEQPNQLASSQRVVHLFSENIRAEKRPKDGKKYIQFAPDHSVLHRFA